MFRLLLIFALCQVTSLYAGAKKTLNKDKKDTSKEWLQDQDDQTDTLAIPLDNSEAEEEMEEAELKKLQKKPVSPPPARPNNKKQY